MTTQEEVQFKLNEWVVVPQLIKVRCGREWREVESLVKTVKMFRREDKETGESRWTRLKNPRHIITINLKRLVADNNPVKITGSGGSFSVVWPPRHELAKIKLGSRTAIDRLEPRMVTVKVEPDKFPSLKTLCDFCAKRFGQHIADEVNRLLGD